MRILNEKQREMLKLPFGEVLNEKEAVEKLKKEKDIIAVGDQSVLMMIKYSIKYWIGVFDLMTKRKEIPEKEKEIIFSQITDLIKVKNPAGTITEELELAVNEAVKDSKTKHIFIQGEEDLAVTPLIEQCGEGTVIVYGMPNKGLVFCRVDKEVKERVRQMWA